MALFIEDDEWPLGEPLPVGAEHRVWRIWADGDELDMILTAMRATRLKTGAEQVSENIRQSLASTHEPRSFTSPRILEAPYGDINNTSRCECCGGFGSACAANDGPEVAILSVEREQPPKFKLVGAVKALLAAARCFSFRTDDIENDSYVIGKIRATSICAGEVQRLNEALAAFDETL